MPSTPSEKDQALHAACKSLNIQDVQRALDEGANIESVISRCRPLHVASKTDNGQEVVKLLLDSGADLLSRDGLGQSALHLAVGRSDIQILEILTDAILAAKAAGNPRATLDLPGFQAETPLLWAARSKPEAVKLLLSKGADSGAKDIRGITPLTIAFGQAKDDAICNAFVEGILSRDIPRLDFIKGCCKALVALTQLSDMWGLDKMLSILQAKEMLPEINGFKGAGGVTLLHIAAANIDELIELRPSRETAVEVLLRYGFDANARSDDGMIPLQRAILNTKVSPRMVEALVKVTSPELFDVTCSVIGPQNNSQDVKASLMHLAVRSGREDYVKILLSCGVPFDIADATGILPINVAISLGRLKIVETLIEKIDDINVETKDGETLLDFAVGRAIVNDQVISLERLLDQKKGIGRDILSQFQGATDESLKGSLRTQLNLLHKEILDTQSQLEHSISQRDINFGVSDYDDVDAITAMLLLRGVEMHGMQLGSSPSELDIEAHQKAINYMKGVVRNKLLTGISEKDVQDKIIALLLTPDNVVAEPNDEHDRKMLIEAFKWAKDHEALHVLRKVLSLEVINNAPEMQVLFHAMKMSENHEVADIGYLYCSSDHQTEEVHCTGGDSLGAGN
ncbi:MAG: ankyrin repeat domain-containing protein [Pseudomonadota bacterium]